ncbi:large neutral amino acids transporter small subunit 4-like isoform X2 [Dendrobates tinctorius]|uniref:large neutral amino acids transporter small subunit 4-like isoform X2 n=1 Tax=Dendrobates tinctorius TaxID=92724 RepID=UPI003CC958A4
MGRVLRLWLLTSALVETLLFSGCLLGWNSLSPILMDEGVLYGDCQSELEQSEARSNESSGGRSRGHVGLEWSEVGGNDSSGGQHAARVELVSPLMEKEPGPRDPQHSCTSQERNLNLGFTVGTFFVWGAFLPLQLLLGYAHIRSLRQIGGALMSVSYLMLAYCLTNPKNLSLFLPFALISQGLGGSCILFSSLMLSHLLDDVGSLFSALVIACFSSSATIFTLIKVLYYLGVPIVPILLFYGALSCAMFLNSTLCWNLQPPEKEADTVYSVRLQLNCYEAMKKKKPQEDNWCQKSLKLKFQESLRDRERILSQRRTLSFRRPNVTAPTPLLESLTCPTFLLHLLSDSALLTWIYCYVSSVNSHLQSKAEDHGRQGDLYSSVFGALQMLGLFAAPLISILLHNQRIRKMGKARDQSAARNPPRSACSVRRLATVYALRTLLVICFGIICLVPSLHIQVIGFILHVAIRTSMFLVGTTLYLCVFPCQHFGALLGINMLISSIVSLIQHPIFLLVTGTLKKDTFWVHAAFLALSLVAVALPLHLIVQNHRRHRDPHSRPIHLRQLPPSTCSKA